LLHYPKIPGSRDCPAGRCFAFEKLDGTNLHWDWDRDFGWHAFGTRRDSFNLTADGIGTFVAAHPELAGAPAVFDATLAAGLEAVFRDHEAYQQFPAFQVFTEYLGPNSFAGKHRADDPKQTVLIDVRAEGYGFLGPEAFVRDFGHLPTPRVVYRGKPTGAFLEAVRSGRYGVAEGVVVKGGTGGADVWMAKVKTTAYLERLKQAFADRWEEYWE
jgi:hypothetical protein